MYSQSSCFPGTKRSVKGKSHLEDDICELRTRCEGVSNQVLSTVPGTKLWILAPTSPFGGSHSNTGCRHHQDEESSLRKKKRRLVVSKPCSSSHQGRIMRRARRLFRAFSLHIELSHSLSSSQDTAAMWKSSRRSSSSTTSSSSQ